MFYHALNARQCFPKKKGNFYVDSVKKRAEKQHTKKGGFWTGLECGKDM